MDEDLVLRAVEGVHHRLRGVALERAPLLPVFDVEARVPRGRELSVALGVEVLLERGPVLERADEDDRREDPDEPEVDRAEEELHRARDRAPLAGRRGSFRGGRLCHNSFRPHGFSASARDSAAMISPARGSSRPCASGHGSAAWALHRAPEMRTFAYDVLRKPFARNGFRRGNGERDRHAGCLGGMGRWGSK